MNCMNSKHSSYPDLILPLACCVYGEPVKDCPFAEFWKISSMEKRINKLYQLETDQLENMRQFHQLCVRLKRMTGSHFSGEAIKLSDS